MTASINTSENIYYRAGYPLHEYLHHFVATRKTRCLAALRELALVIPRCRTDQFSQSFVLPVVVRLWNLLPSNVFRGGPMSSFKSDMNLYLQRAQLNCFPLFISVSHCSSIVCLVSWSWGRSDF